MAVLKPRVRMISVRLSEEEYSALKQLCLLTGARSVSDLTRDAMRGLLNGTNRDSMLVVHMDEFRSQITNLDRKIEHLMTKITTVKGTVPID
jgi:hypothetical protein